MSTSATPKRRPRRSTPSDVRTPGVVNDGELADATDRAKLQPGVLVIYTGGTIGSKPRDPDPDSPQVVVPWEVLRGGTPEVDEVPFVVDCHAMEPRDSCNVDPAYWQEMAEVIAGNYNRYAGFVVLHGTDTMVYTACALSFMLRNLGKPVVLTGAQRSRLVSIRNDATQNFLTALEIANPGLSNLPVVPEVCILFGGRLWRGNRAVKRDASGYEAYETPNLEPLGEVGDRIVINERVIRPLPAPGKSFNLRKALDTNVFPIFISPGIQETNIAESVLATDRLRAAVVMSFGAGNIPTRPEFVDTFRKARERGIIVANVTQCPRGPVEQGLYETSAELLEAGFVAADDITVEAAVTKLMVLLGDDDLRVDQVEHEFQRSLAGEQSVSLLVTSYPDSDGRVGDDPGEHRIRGMLTEGRLASERTSRALLRLWDAEVTAPDPQNTTPVEFRVFLNLDKGAVADDRAPNFGGRFRRWPTQRPGITMFDVTAAFRSTVEAGERVAFTIFSDTPGASLSWKRAELAVLVRE